MSREYDFFVYMVSNYAGTVFYTGMTNDLHRRLWEHQTGSGSQFTRQYRVDRLVYFEHYDEVSKPLRVRKRLKDGRARKRKHSFAR